MGYSLTEYEAMTPAELAGAARVYAGREKARRREREDALYLLACMTGCAVWGRLGSYEELFGKRKKENAGMTDEQMLAQVRALNAVFGGGNSYDSGEVRT